VAEKLFVQTRSGALVPKGWVYPLILGFPVYDQIQMAKNPIAVHWQTSRIEDGVRGDVVGPGVRTGRGKARVGQTLRALADRPLPWPSAFAWWVLVYAFLDCLVCLFWSGLFIGGRGWGGLLQFIQFQMGFVHFPDGQMADKRRWPPPWAAILSVAALGIKSG
jgi:hypothetical protein